MNESKKRKTTSKGMTAATPVVPLVMQFFFTGGVEKEHGVDILGRTHPLPLTWADGMIGVIPVFETREAAETYADGKLRVYSVEVEQRIA